MGQRIPVTLGNITPLAVQPFRSGKIALVCEGGGQRGIFTAGVLDEFMRARFNPFDTFLGTSAGAQNLSAYVCNQPGYAHRVITHYTTTREFFNPVRFVRGGNLIDLDWLVDSTAHQMPLAMNNAYRLFDNGKLFQMCACRSDDYGATYFTPQKTNWMDIIRASSAIPGFYRTEVSLDGVRYLDGGVSDAIPVREAARLGAETLVVIRTVPSQMFYTPQWFKRMERWLGESSLQPLVNLVHHHELSYGEIQQFIDKPPGDLRVFEIYPPRPLLSMALGSGQLALRADYKVGRLCGRYFLATVGKMLAEQPPLLRHSQHRTCPAMPVGAPAVSPTNMPVNAPVLAANDVASLPTVDTPQANDGGFSQKDSA